MCELKTRLSLWMELVEYLTLTLLDSKIDLSEGFGVHRYNLGLSQVSKTVLPMTRASYSSHYILCAINFGRV